MKFDPASKIQQLKQFGEFGDVNPSITDSSTYTFLHGSDMAKTFEGMMEGCFLYSRHWNPTNKYLSEALAAMEDTESAWVTGSGMAAITCALLQLCKQGDHILTSVTTYGGTFAFLKNWLPKYGIEVTFVDISDLDSIKKAIQLNTKVIYTESVTNPLLQVSDIPALAEIARSHNIKLMVDNTFTPMIISPKRLGADVVVYSMTKFINGKNDCVAGAICGTEKFISELSIVNDGTAMLLGPVLDPMRSASILKNIHTLHLRMRQHGRNALYIAERLEKLGVSIRYPGLASHAQHQLHKSIMNESFGFGGMLAIDLGTGEKANEFMQLLQDNGVGYLAVSLGYFKTLFSCSGKSTSSEIPQQIQDEMGLSEGLVRFSVGLDNDIANSYLLIEKCLKEIGIAGSN